MKSVNNKLKSILSLVAVLVLTTISTATFASNDKVAKNTKSIPTEVKYLYTVNGNDIIQVDIDNENGDDLTITLIDAEGEELYSELVSDKKISKKFLMDMPDFTSKKITLTVTSKKGGINQSLLLSKQSLMAKM